MLIGRCRNYGASIALSFYFPINFGVFLVIYGQISGTRERYVLSLLFYPRNQGD